MNSSLLFGSLRPSGGQPGFALISVLALVSLAALTATAFLASARLERTSTRPLGERVRLEMALNIGMNCAKEIINDGVGSSYGNVVTYWRTNVADDLGYMLLGTPRFANASPAMYWYAAFSTGLMGELATNSPPNLVISNRTTVTNQSMFSNVMNNFMIGLTNFTNGSTNIELLGHTINNPRLSPPVGWITIRQPVRNTPGSTNTVNQPVMRFAFFVEDLSGLIDAERMCGSPRTSGTNPAEISMADLGIPFSTDPTQRATYLSPLLLSSNGGVSTANLRYFATGLRSWTNAIQRIPRHVAIKANTGYAGAISGDGGKLSLTNPANLVVSTIANAIANNLPDFTNRAGAMAGNAYLNNLGANIVDYIDADSTPSVDTSASPPAWRGVEAIAWPNEVFTRFTYTNRTLDGGVWTFPLQIKNYIEVWNLSTNSILVSGSSFAIFNNMNIPLKCVNYVGNLKSFATPIFEPCTNNQPFQLPANSYGVIATATRVVNILVPAGLVGGQTNPALEINPTTTNNSYTISYNGLVIDATSAGRWLGKSVSLKSGDFHFISTAVNFGTSGNGTTYNLAGGDPRGGLFIKQPAMDFPYNETTPGGRNSHNSSSGGARIVDPAINWVDGGHSSSADVVASPVNANANNSIAQNLQKQGNPNHWLQKFNNTGALTNMAELGNIFDPIQWGDPKNPFHPLDTAAWMGLSNTATAFSGACGRNTLRIGRPEHPLFAFTNLGGPSDLPVPNMGQSAAALLDIFCTSTTSDNGGKVNLNTAPGLVLKALAGGISISSDPAKAGAEKNANMITAFTNGVMRFRKAYPFYSPSQLAFISTNYAATIGWTNAWQSSAVFSTNSTGAGLSGITEANDQALEEWFSKIYNLTAVESHNFRVYVYAQMVNSNNVPYGRIMRKYYHIYAEQTADTSGTPFSGAGYSLIPERECEY